MLNSAQQNGKKCLGNLPIDSIGILKKDTKEIYSATNLTILPGPSMET